MIYKTLLYTHSCHSRVMEGEKTNADVGQAQTEEAKQNTNENKGDKGMVDFLTFIRQRIKCYVLLLFYDESSHRKYFNFEVSVNGTTFCEEGNRSRSKKADKKMAPLTALAGLGINLR